MPARIDLPALCAIVRTRGATGRSITAIAGPPGAGKSTLADALCAMLNDSEPGSAAVLPMDGYHYDDLILLPRGLRSRKGAPDTFDVSGFAHMLARLKANREAEIAVPVFDRAIEIARAGARMIPSDVRHLIVEGNYLLFGTGLWRQLHGHYDTTVLIDVAEPELRQRLEARWKDLGADARNDKIDGNDLPNGRRVKAESVVPEFLIG